MESQTPAASDAVRKAMRIPRQICTLNISLRVFKDRPQCLIDLGVSKNKAEPLSFGWYRALTGQQEWGGHFSKCKTKCECRRRHEGRPVHRPT